MKSIQALGRALRPFALALAAAGVVAGATLVEAQTPPPPGGAAQAPAGARGGAPGARSRLAGGGSPGAPAAPDPATAPHRDFSGGVVALTDVTYSTQSGYRPLKLDLYLVPGRAAPKPLVIWVHGGAWQVGDQRGVSIRAGGYQDQPALLAAMAARGYVTAGVSYRLSGEAKFPAAVQDVKAAVRWLRANAAKYGIDPNKIVIWGGSAGGQIANLVGTSCNVPELEGRPARGAEVSSCVQGVISFYGYSDLTAIGHPGPSSPEAAYLGCDLAECPPDKVRLASPVSFIDKTDPPFLIVHGDADTTVTPKQSQELYDRLKAAGVKADLMWVPGANHIFVGATDAETKQIVEKVNGFLDEIAAASPAR